MTQRQKSEIIRMRTRGTSFSKISEVTGISINTVKSFCRRKGVTVNAQNLREKESDKTRCKECGAKLNQIPGRKTRRFCCKECRVKWWNAHPEEVNRKAVYAFVCGCCGKRFTAYGNKSRKFCSHDCYITARFGKGEYNE